MSIRVQIPRVLQADCGGKGEFAVEARTVRDALDEIERAYPSLYRSVCDDTGAVRRHVNVFVNDEYLRDRDGLDTVLAAGDVLTIFQAVSGG